ncbi:MAG: DUF2330 domain-containing protein [Ktedonobacterales bacterium]
MTFANAPMKALANALTTVRRLGSAPGEGRSRARRRFFQLGFAAACVLTLQALVALPALACGGLVAPDGDVRLARATTLVAWHDGIEHYLTGFAYQGNESSVGWIVPLPANPIKIEAGGRWTFQRLAIETHPQPKGLFGAAAVSNTASAAQVLQQVQVEALDVTILKGSGSEVIEWCNKNAFFLSDDTRAHLLAYANGSPFFMAAKYDTAAAKARRQQTGDGVPLLLTMQTAHPWVPLEVLALDGQQVHADLYMLTDMALNTNETSAIVGQSAVGSELPGAPGFREAFQERLTPTLYHDLSTDRNMGWVRQDSWLTYLTLDAEEAQVTYDLGVTSNGVITLAPFGTAPMKVSETRRSFASSLPHLPIGTPEVAITVLAVLALGLGLFKLLAWGASTAPVDPHWLEREESHRE